MSAARILHDLDAVRAYSRDLHARGRRLGLVPTMGALHEGHLSLVDRARARADEVMVSIFVNPLQFAPGEDLERYPRDLDGDVALLAPHGADVVFAPAPEAMWPSGPPRVSVDPGPAGDRLCGAYRPGHFRGVLTVVAKLFALVEPDVAVFGRKDFQQSVLIRRMNADLGFGVEVDVAPIVREPDGLALSSRNRYLSEDERSDALGLSAGLATARDGFAGGVRSTSALLGRYLAEVATRRRLRPQYQEIVDPDTLEPLDVARPGAVLAVAAYCGETRLIDNTVLGSEG